MATTTTNLGLIKPASTDLVDPVGGAPSDLNTNFDTIDRAKGPSSALVATVTVASSVTETVVHTLTIPAGSAAVGSSYAIVAYLNAAVASAGTITFRLRVGGVAGAVIATVTTASGTFTTAPARLAGELICVTTGVSATWLGGLAVYNNFPTAILANSAALALAATPQTKDSTVADDLVLTVQHSVNNAGNTISAYSGYGCKVTNA